MINKRSSDIGASYFHEAETGHDRGFSLALGKGGGGASFQLQLLLCLFLTFKQRGSIIIASTSGLK